MPESPQPSATKGSEQYSSGMYLWPTWMRVGSDVVEFFTPTVSLRALNQGPAALTVVAASMAEPSASCAPVHRPPSSVNLATLVLNRKSTPSRTHARWRSSRHVDESMCPQPCS